MEYELKALELMVSVTLNTNAIKLNDKENAIIHEAFMQAHSEVARVKLQFIEAACQVDNEKQFELYIRQHQLSLIQIVDTLFGYQQLENTSSIHQLTSALHITRLYTEFYEAVDGLLTFIERRFYIYLDQDITIPVAYSKLMAAEIETNINYIQTTLVAYDISPLFMELILHPFKNILFQVHIVTYRELLFIKELQRRLFFTLAKEDKSSMESNITNIFLNLNFNCRQYINFYITEVHREAQRLPSIQEQIDFYYFKMKLINQQPVKRGFVFKPLLPPLKEQIGTWLSEELYFLERKQAAIAMQGAAIKPGSQTKLHTSLSVAHLSLAVKLLIDSKVITNKNATELMRIVASNFRTDRRENISEDSLRNKSYNIESSSVNGMKDVIIGIMNLVGKY